MASMADTIQAADGPARLKDIPGDSGLPIIGNTLKVLGNPLGYGRTMRKKYGNIYRTNAFFRDTVNILGPDGNEFVLMDKDKVFSSELGWAPYIRLLFPRGLMLMDFDMHRAHRKIMNVAFKTDAMRAYCERLNDEMPASIAAWGRTGHFEFYPAVKALSLDMATRVFLGLKPGPETDKVNKALTDMVAASVAVIRKPVPGTKMWRGVRARRFMVEFLGALIPKRRQEIADDIFTLLCQAEDEEGNRFTDQEIIDHMIFLWMAAHDTITSSVTTLVYELARHREWQQKLRDEIAGLGLNDDRLPYEKLSDMVLTEYAFKEALRINPPVPSMPRETLRDVEFKGIRIPKGTIVSISPVMTHNLADVWGNPQEWDPMRFTPERAAGRHRFAWVPFGGGAHMCLGLHFAYMQAKIIMAHLLPHFDIVVPEGYKTRFQILPLIKPVDGLPVTLKPVG